jgi:hypothetical protein
MVGEEGLEPSWFIQPADFKSTAYTNSATRPGGTDGSRTRVNGFADRCLTPRPPRHQHDYTLFNRLKILSSYPGSQANRPRYNT